MDEDTAPKPVVITSQQRDSAVIPLSFLMLVLMFAQAMGLIPPLRLPQSAPAEAADSSYTRSLSSNEAPRAETADAKPQTSTADLAESEKESRVEAEAKTRRLDRPPKIEALPALPPSVPSEPDLDDILPSPIPTPAISLEVVH